jgi:hypothetical protein
LEFLFFAFFAAIRKGRMAAQKRKKSEGGAALTTDEAHASICEGEKKMDEIIFTYTTEQAVGDGLLFPVMDVIYEKLGAGWPLDRFTGIRRGLAKFNYGRVYLTPGAKDLPLDETLGALGRHLLGDWGELCEEDGKRNDVALNAGGGRLFSAYSIWSGKDQVRIWVITEADRSVTTVLLPLEY